jgi:hypothetical protein
MGTGLLTRAAVFPVLFVTAWLMLSPAAGPAAYAALTPATASAGCPAAEIIGVHGTSEGPSSTDSNDSPEIKATFAAFAADEQKLGEHGARLEYYADKDPICGQGWPPYEIGGQIIAAALCGLDRCPHLSYSGAPASYAAEFLAESAFKRPRGDG